MDNKHEDNSDRSKILAVIPARGGSKGLRRKNVLPLLDKPMIAYAIEAAQGARLIDRVIVSTDDDEIASVARKHGAEVPFMRPAELGGDNVPWVPVLKHALIAMSEQYSYHADAVVTLQATTPLLSSELIDRCVRVFRDSQADSVVTICEDSRNYKEWKQEDDGSFTPLFDLRRPNRQLVRHNYREDGYVYISSREVLLNHDRLTGERTKVVICDEIPLDIHEEVDCVVAEALLRWKSSQR